MFLIGIFQVLDLIHHNNIVQALFFIYLCLTFLTEYMCYNQTGDISTLDGTPLKLVWFVGFYGISTFVGYLTPNPFLCK